MLKTDCVNRLPRNLLRGLNSQKKIEKNSNTGAKVQITILGQKKKGISLCHRKITQLQKKPPKMSHIEHLLYLLSLCVYSP